ncbi:MAG: hypothetical protein AMXMBFR7_36590 [Planctomycetota bacterium]
MMSLERMRELAWIADAFVRPPIRALVLRFHGLGDPGLRVAPSYSELEWADAGALIVMPYLGPWYWMNRQSRAATDELVDGLYRHFKLLDTTPLIATGGSLGGFASLLYARYARRPVAACAALHPVTDVKFSFSERPDVARTVYAAFQGYPEDMEALFREHSPLSQVEQMPRIPYLFMHGDADVAVSKKAHSDPMVKALLERGHQVEYHAVPGMGHHDLPSWDLHRIQIDFVKRHFAAT